MSVNTDHIYKNKVVAGRFEGKGSRYLTKNSNNFDINYTHRNTDHSFAIYIDGTSHSQVLLTFWLFHSQTDEVYDWAVEFSHTCSLEYF